MRRLGSENVIGRTSRYIGAPESFYAECPNRNCMGQISATCKSLVAELSLKRIETDKWFNGLLFLAQLDNSILFHVL